MLGYKTILDYSDQPLEVYDGIEPKSLMLTPSVCRLSSSYHSIDLMLEIANKYRQDSIGAQYANMYRVIPVRVVVLNKSANKKESVLGYLGIIPKRDGSEKKIVLFSFFEVSAGRYHCYVHKLFEEVNATV